MGRGATPLEADRRAAWLASLVEGRRAVRARLPDGRPAWVATETVPLVTAAFPDVRFDPAPLALPDQGEPPTGDEAELSLVRARAECIGPFTASELARALGMRRAAVDIALARLEANGNVLQGRFTPGREEDEYCDRRALARIHRDTISGLRKQVEPVSAATFVRFLFRWQRASSQWRVQGEGGLLDVIDQLQGFEAAAGSWESDIFPSRVANYGAAMLDELCLGGEVVWGEVLRAALQRRGPREQRDALPQCPDIAGTSRGPALAARRDADQRRPAAWGRSRGTRSPVRPRHFVPAGHHIRDATPPVGRWRTHCGSWSPPGWSRPTGSEPFEGWSTAAPGASGRAPGSGGVREGACPPAGGRCFSRVYGTTAPLLGRARSGPRRRRLRRTRQKRGPYSSCTGMAWSSPRCWRESLSPLAGATCVACTAVRRQEARFAAAVRWPGSSASSSRCLRRSRCCARSGRPSRTGGDSRIGVRPPEPGRRADPRPAGTRGDWKPHRFLNGVPVASVQSGEVQLHGEVDQAARRAVSELLGRAV